MAVQVTFKLTYNHRDKVQRRRNSAVNDGDAGGLIRVCSALCCNNHLLSIGRFSLKKNEAVLENNSGISKNEVYSAVYMAVSVKLAL